MDFYEVVNGGQVGLSLRSMYQDVGIPIKIEIQSDSSTANSLTDRLGAGQRTKHIDTRYFWIQERVQDGDISIKKVPTAKNCADVGTNPASAFGTTTTLQVCRIGILLTMDPALHCKMMARAGDGAGDGAAAQKQKIVNVGREHRDGCAKLSETSLRVDR